MKKINLISNILMYIYCFSCFLLSFMEIAHWIFFLIGSVLLFINVLFTEDIRLEQIEKYKEIKKRK